MNIDYKQDFPVSCLMLEGFSDTSKEADFFRKAIELMARYGHAPRYISVAENGSFKEKKIRISKTDETLSKLDEYWSVDFSDKGVYGARDGQCPYSFIILQRSGKNRHTRLMMYLPSEFLVNFEVIVGKYRNISQNIYLFQEMLWASPLTYFLGVPFDIGIRNYQYSSILQKKRILAWQRYYLRSDYPTCDKIRDIYDTQISEATLIRSIYEKAVDNRRVDNTMIQFETLSGGQARLDVEGPMQDIVRNIADRLGVVASSASSS